MSRAVCRGPDRAARPQYVCRRSGVAPIPCGCWRFGTPIVRQGRVPVAAEGERAA